MSQNIPFFKYQGTGNDFVVINNQSQHFKYDTKLIKRLCDRKFGIGADGLICLETHSDNAVDFKMVYFNADGNESTMCGNGGRCIVAFAKYLDLIEDTCIFEAVDGLHDAKIDENFNVELKMKDVSTVEEHSGDFVLDTGSPHYVRIVDHIKDIDVPKEGSSIRYSEPFKVKGINVNFIQFKEGKLHVRTYERGVEDETLSCGTGVTAAALSSYKSKLVNSKLVRIKAQGGDLKVRFEVVENGFEHIWLIGSTQQVFKGEILC